jgi:RNA polymerase sigma factor (TIGR02999 family)
MDASARITVLLDAARRGSAEAFREVFPLVYRELRELARRCLDGEGQGHTLQPTALVHEAFLKLVKQDSAGCRTRAEFFGLAAQAMRRVLVDHARARKRDKRGGGASAEPLTDTVALFEVRALDLVALDEALARLELNDERKARLVELRFFAGLSADEAAEVLGVTTRTAERDWAMARAWLRKELDPVA